MMFVEEITTPIDMTNKFQQLYTEIYKALKPRRYTNRSTKETIENSDVARKRRSRGVVVEIVKGRPKHRGIANRHRFFEFKAKSKEMTEGRIQKGFVQLNTNKSVVDCFCSCGDFGYRWRTPLVDSNMADFDVDAAYESIANPTPHNQEDPVITNPLHEKKFCKHLLAVMNKLRIK
jgi:SWIM zinc finger